MIKKALIAVLLALLLAAVALGVRSGFFASAFRGGEAVMQQAAEKVEDSIPTDGPSPTSTITLTPTPVTPTMTPTITLTPTVTPTLTLTPTETPTQTFTPSPTPCPIVEQYELATGHTVDNQQIVLGAYVPGTGLPGCMRHFIHEQTYVSWFEWANGSEDGNIGQAPDLCYRGDLLRRLPRKAGEPTPAPLYCN